MRFASSIFYALTAHFGQWVAGVGRRTRQWQVAIELIYGQVKKVYRQRRVVRSPTSCAAGHAQRFEERSLDWA
jgi:hypothetical protein